MGLVAAMLAWAAYEAGRGRLGTLLAPLTPDFSGGPVAEALMPLREAMQAWANSFAATAAGRSLASGASVFFEHWHLLAASAEPVPEWVLASIAGLALFCFLGLLHSLLRRAPRHTPSQSRALTIYEGRQPPRAEEVERPSDSARGAILAGWATLLVFFGGFGTWAATAPLNGAVVGEALVKVEGNRKSVQHFEGGTVSEIRVQEGSRVQTGDVLIVLDDSRTRAEYDVLLQQHAVLRATEARLQAEFDRRNDVEFPPDLSASTEPFVVTAIEGQKKEFASRRTATQGMELVLKQRAAQLDEQIAGYRAQQAALEVQLASVQSELESLAELLTRGLITKPRVLQLQRSAAGLQGEIASTGAAIASAKQALGEVSEQSAQLHKDRSAEVTAALRDLQARLLDVEPRLRNAANVLDRNAIRSPYAGKVVDLAVFSVGGVIRPGERIMDIVPEETSLVVEAKVRLEDIAEIGPGMAAEIHFTSYKQRITPVIHGTVTEVSADRLTDERTGLAYYAAVVDVDDEELAASPEIQLYPGMPATVMITTQERTALDYLLGPLTTSFNSAFRQR
ncbi:MAG: HlyD family type I secretion periplasmic adaptor subunit [Rhizobiaceae bacterium]|nr:HlyD family type I secretion periplasmic adaptor subunit [Rhizobiaceae bacterium]MCV0405606.1 HlyD family type I secretion periplasmic adaptor subunit [Rhizobiaceae bacterium]